LGMSLALVNYDELFHSLRHPVTIVNDVSTALASEKEEFNKQIYTKYAGNDLLSNLPSCENGCTVGERHKGDECPECHTIVVDPTMQELQPIIWMRAPIGVRSLINPTFWTQLSDFFSKGSFDVLRWIADTGYHPIVKTPAVLDTVRALIPERGYNYFLDNFDFIINTLMESKVYRVPAKRRQAAELMQMIKQYRKCLFPQYLPLPNKSLLVIEKSNVGTYVDTTVPGAVDAIRTMASIDLPESNFNIRFRENRTIKTICQLGEFHIEWASKSLAGKTGVVRKHLLGTRSDFSFRAVISSISEAHDYREIHISWGIAVAVLHVHLANKLANKHGMTANEIIGFLDEHAQKFNKLLSDLFDELIAECPYPGIPVVLGRNPSLQRGSTQLLYITKVKHDPRIPTISLSVLVLKSYNADFDGDQVNCSLSLDHRTVMDQMALAPHMSTFDLDEPRHLSSSLSLTKPAVSTIAEWMHDEEGPLTPEQELAMSTIPEAA
jgi:hypothetical protein